MLELIHNKASKTILILALIVTIIASAVMMLIILPQFIEISEGQLPLDMRLWYTPAEFVNLAETLGSEGIAIYHLFQIVDMIFPIALAITLSTAIALINGVILPNESKAKKFAIIPFFTALFDYSENILIWYQLDVYPLVSSNMLFVTAFISVTKLSLLMFSLVIVFGWIGMYLLKRETIV